MSRLNRFCSDIRICLGSPRSVQPNNEFYAPAYAVFAQDDWKVSSRLTINYGLRWEYHPMMQDHLLNITNFDPDYKSVVNGQQVARSSNHSESGRIQHRQSCFCPVRRSDSHSRLLKMDFQGHAFFAEDRFFAAFGIAWKPFNNNRTVLRGGYGRFIEALTGGLADDGGTVASAIIAFFPNSIVNGKPQYTFPYPFPSNLAVPGSQ